MKVSISESSPRETARPTAIETETAPRTRSALTSFLTVLRVNPLGCPHDEPRCCQQLSCASSLVVPCTEIPCSGVGRAGCAAPVFACAAGARSPRPREARGERGSAAPVLACAAGARSSRPREARGERGSAAPVPACAAGARSSRPREARGERGMRRCASAGGPRGCAYFLYVTPRGPPRARRCASPAAAATPTGQLRNPRSEAPSAPRPRGAPKGRSRGARRRRIRARKCWRCGCRRTGVAPRRRSR